MNPEVIKLSQNANERPRDGERAPQTTTVVIHITMMIPNAENILILRKKNKQCNHSPSDNDPRSRVWFFFFF